MFSWRELCLISFGFNYKCLYFHSQLIAIANKLFTAFSKEQVSLTSKRIKFPKMNEYFLTFLGINGKSNLLVL